MSQENVELLYRSYDAVNRRDLDGLLALMDDDVEAVSRIAAMEGGLHGHHGMRRWWESWLGAFPDYKIEVDQVRDRGDFVFTALRAQGHGAGSQLPFEDTLWHATRWRRGKCVWWRVCSTWAEALEAAGLSDDPTLDEVLASPQVYGGDAFNNVGDLLSVHAGLDVAYDENGNVIREHNCPLGNDPWEDPA